MENFFLLLGELFSGVIISSGIVYFLVKSFLSSYISEKAKNLASKEDIEAITEKVESVKSDYAHLLEEVKSDYQLKYAMVEREKRTKKEVYMDAVEAITRSLNMLPMFSNLSLKESEITSILNVDAGKIAKVQIVGNKETVKAINNFMENIGTSTLDLMLNRTNLISRESLIQINIDFRDKKLQEIDKYIEIMKNLNLQNNTDKSLWDVVKRSIDFEQDQYGKYQSEIDKIQAIQNEEHLAFTRDCMERFFKISILLPPAILSIRNELDLEISSDEYIKMYSDSIEKGRQSFEGFLKRLKQVNAGDDKKSTYC